MSSNEINNLINHDFLVKLIVIGDAGVGKSSMCNFFVNNGNAKSSDIEKLINKVKKTVVEKTGVNLELEIKIIGEEKAL